LRTGVKLRFSGVGFKKRSYSVQPRKGNLKLQFLISKLTLLMCDAEEKILIVTKGMQKSCSAKLKKRKKEMIRIKKVIKFKD
jgi:hypothetical protein